MKPPYGAHRYPSHLNPTISSRSLSWSISPNIKSEMTAKLLDRGHPSTQANKSTNLPMTSSILIPRLRNKSWDWSRTEVRRQTPPTRKDMKDTVMKTSSVQRNYFITGFSHQNFILLNIFLTMSVTSWDVLAPHRSHPSLSRKFAASGPVLFIFFI